MVKVLVVDDTALERRRAGALLEKRQEKRDFPPSPDVQVLYASNGKEAVDVLRKIGAELVVTDLMMPEMNGLELVQEVRAHYPAVPVILMTAHGSEEIAALALQNGAAGYVPKRFLVRDLRETVDNVLDLSHADREQRHIVQHLLAMESRFTLPSDLGLIGPLVAYLQSNLKRLGLFDYVDELRVTIALREALVNAVTYGSLEVPSALRESDEPAFRRLLIERRAQPPYRERRVHVLACESPREVRYVVRDEGPGFQPSSLPDPTDPSNLDKSNGRGLYLIRTFMDEVAHNAAGTEITMVKRKR
jgi:CheY-like chemotaxis protein